MTEKIRLEFTCESSARQIADDSHEMSSLIFSENILKKKKKKFEGPLKGLNIHVGLWALLIML